MDSGLDPSGDSTEKNPYSSSSGRDYGQHRPDSRAEKKEREYYSRTPIVPKPLKPKSKKQNPVITIVKKQAQNERKWLMNAMAGSRVGQIIGYKFRLRVPFGEVGFELIENAWGVEITKKGLRKYSDPPKHNLYGRIGPAKFNSDGTPTSAELKNWSFSKDLKVSLAGGAIYKGVGGEAKVVFDLMSLINWNVPKD